VGQRTVRWIEEYDRAAPWLLWVGFGGPHNPWDAPVPYAEQYRAATLPLGPAARPETDPATPFGAYLAARLQSSDAESLTEDAVRAMRAAYYANITLIDEQVGAVIEALRRRGMLENTWIIYTSDHGEMAGDHGLLMKRVFYEPAAGVPLIVRPPGGMQGQTVDLLVEQVDLGATFRAIAAAPALGGSEGRSLLACFGWDGVAPARDYAHSETLGYGAFITGRYKLVVDEERGETVQLFDLVTDPSEERNLVHDATHAAVRDQILEEHVRVFLRRPMPALPEIAGAMSED
jgi:choline-sulfatase